MPLQADLYAVVSQDVELMDSCFRPMGFASRHVEDPITPVQARAWLDSCEPLFKRLGKRASEELLAGAKRLREREPGHELETGDTDKGRQSAINLDVHSFFERLAAEYLKQGARPHAVEQIQFQSEVILEAFEFVHFDRKLLVPTSTDAHDHDTSQAFASAPITHTSFGRYYIWRGAEQVRAFFPHGRLFGPPEDSLLKPPSAQELIALKRERSSWVSPSPTEALESAQGMINAYREQWSTLVEVLRTAARFGGAFISVCQNTTDYE